jgi:hypothetical protein
MLRTIHELEGYGIRANDGLIGHVRDFYFDDNAWVIRFLVVESGSWLNSRKVLISPYSVGQAEWENRILPVSLSMDQVKKSPSIDADKPVSRQHELEYLNYYNYPRYWGGTGLWGDDTYPGMLLSNAGYGGVDDSYAGLQAAKAVATMENEGARKTDPHLRSCNAVIDYHIEATDGDIGHVAGMLADEATWAVRYLIVDTSNWWAGHKVLIVPQWIENVSWFESTVTVNLTRTAVKDAPIYDSAAHLDREMEMDIYLHYGHPGYWATELKREAAKVRRAR